MERKTKIIATIGPASKSEEVLSQMISFIDMARLNFSWGTYSEMADMIDTIRKVATQSKKVIPIIQDLSGPREQTESGHHLHNNNDSVITEKDLRDLKFGVEHAVDYIAMSYVKSKEDIMQLKSELAKYGVVIPVIAKIERKEAVDNIDLIIQEADGIMVARGDLGQAFPIEEVPFIQRKIVQKCNEKNKMVIVATEIFFSMIESPRPTRAEVTDVLYAVSNGADAVMLSDETARGQYPIEAVSIMNKLLAYDESHITK